MQQSWKFVLSRVNCKKKDKILPLEIKEGIISESSGKIAKRSAQVEAFENSFHASKEWNKKLDYDKLRNPISNLKLQWVRH